MINAKMALPLLTALACLPSASVAAPMFDHDFQDLSVFSNTYTTTGANSWVYGSVVAGDVGTSGAGATITGSLTTVGASTIGGAGSAVGGNMTSGGVLTTGDAATVAGNVLAGGAATVGANSVVSGNVVAAGVVSTGAGSRVVGNVLAGGAASVGATASVGGTVAAVGLISVSASAGVGSTHGLTTSPVDTTALVASLTDTVASDRLQLLAAQAAFAAMATTTFLAPTITTDRTLFSGVYSAASLSTTAGTTLTLDGQGKSDQFWVFNITDILATGASTKIVLLNGATTDSVIWNAGGYASLGASSTFLGTLIASQYISVGASAEALGIGQTCGGLFSALSYVSTGDGARIGGSGCSGLTKYFSIDRTGVAYHDSEPGSQPSAGPVPEPATWAFWIAGFACIGTSLRRKRFVTA